ncbi:lasso RiPP family leader peptide-containing protein [Paramicrobacterium fandaimingii]
MAYESPRISEVGRFSSVTRGSWKPGSERDNSNWWDWFGDPPKGSR